MADFKVAFSNGEVTTYSGEECRYSFQGPVLTVYEGGKRLRFSPAGWLCVEDPEPAHVVPMDEVLIG